MAEVLFFVLTGGFFLVSVLYARALARMAS